MYHEDTPITREDIEDGTYYRKAHEWYSLVYHLPIAERSFYIIVILLAVINGIFGAKSFFGIFPLDVPVPFMIYSDDLWNDLPRIQKIALSPLEDKNQAVMRHLLYAYVSNRESYDLEHYEIRYRNIASQSTHNVFEHYKKSMDATNMYSPYRLYTNRYRRDVYVVSYEFDKSDDVSRPSHATLQFYANVVNLGTQQIVKSGKYQVEMGYQYVDFTVDQSLDSVVFIARLLHLTGDSIRVSGEKRKIVPMKFVVSDYHVSELIE